MIARLNAALTSASTAIEAARREVHRADVLSLSLTADHREQAARSRAAAYVFVSAALERCLKDSLTAVLGEINGKQLAFTDDGAAPVDDGAKDVEDQSHRGRVGRVGSLHGVWVPGRAGLRWLQGGLGAWALGIVRRSREQGRRARQRAVT